MTVYICENPKCSLGTEFDHGRFTGGMTKEQATLKTGDPDPDVFGPGVCPVCGRLATVTAKE
jgi:hypothetical protein